MKTIKSEPRQWIWLLLVLSTAMGGIASCSSDDDGENVITGTACSCILPPRLLVGTSASYRFKEQASPDKEVTVAVLNDRSQDVFDLSITNDGSARVGILNTVIASCCRSPGSPNSTLQLSKEESLTVFANGEWGIRGSPDSGPVPGPPNSPCADTQFVVGSTTFDALRCERPFTRTVNDVRTEYLVVDTTERVLPTVVGGFLSRRVSRLSDSAVVAEATLIQFTR